jgi:hypothetical protein
MRRHARVQYSSELPRKGSKPRAYEAGLPSLTPEQKLSNARIQLERKRFVLGMRPRRDVIAERIAADAKFYKDKSLGKIPRR